MARLIDKLSCERYAVLKPYLVSFWAEGLGRLFAKLSGLCRTRSARFADEFCRLQFGEMIGAAAVDVTGDVFRRVRGERIVAVKGVERALSGEGIFAGGAACVALI